MERIEDQLNRIRERWKDFEAHDVNYLLSIIETQRQTIDKQHVLLDKYETILNEQGYL